MEYRFTQENTQGFTDSQLADMNAELERRIEAAGLDLNADDPQEVDEAVQQVKHWSDEISDNYYKYTTE